MRTLQYANITISMHNIRICRDIMRGIIYENFASKHKQKVMLGQSINTLTSSTVGKAFRYDIEGGLGTDMNA